MEKKSHMDSMLLISAIYIYQLMSTVQLPGSNRFYSQMQIHTGNQNNDVIFSKEFQHHLKKEHQKISVFDQGGNNKRFMEIKWTDIH